MASFAPNINGTMLLSYLKNRRILALLATCIALVLLLQLRAAYSQRPISSYLPSLPSGITSKPVGTTPNHAAADVPDTSTSTFGPQFYAALLAATPRCSLPHNHIEAWISGFKPNSGATQRQDLIHLDEADEAELVAAHAWFVEQVSAPDFPKPHFVPGSKGVVTTAGGEFLPEALVAIRMLRRTGSTLPVDVFMATPEEVEGDICETVLAALGARCHVVSDLIDLEQGGLPRRQTITKYQLKAFALLLSEFDDIVWIDADTFPLVDPRPLMDAEPFKSRGLVTWPDYWFPTVSPLFFRVAGIPEDRVPPPSVRSASETGQLLVSKSRGGHLRTLELVTYYNFHGPTHYYKLFSQGAIGEGDKETFLGAALALGAPFWAVETPIDTIGFNDGGFKSTGMLQADPRHDYKRFANADGSVNTHAHDNPAAPPVPAAFLHDEQHKPNAGRYSKLWRAAVRQRMWQPLDQMVAKFGFDIERAVWDEMVWTACGKEFHGHVFSDWIGNPIEVDEGPEFGDICTQGKAIYREMFGAEPAGETMPTAEAEAAAVVEVEVNAEAAADTNRAR